MTWRPGTSTIADDDWEQVVEFIKAMRDRVEDVEEPEAEVNNRRGAILADIRG